MSGPCMDDSDSVALNTDSGDNHLVATVILDPAAENAAVVNPGAGLFVAGRAQLVSALPASPQDGDEVLLLLADTDRIWHLYYYGPDAAWKFLGGQPARAGVTGSCTRNASSGYGVPDSGTAGPTLTLPAVAGTFRVTIGAQFTGNDADNHMSFAVGATTATDANSIHHKAVGAITNPATTLEGVQITSSLYEQRSMEIPGVIASTVLSMRYSNDSANVATFANRFIEVTPLAGS